MKMSEISSLDELRETLTRIEKLSVDRERRAAWRSFRLSDRLRRDLAGRFKRLDPLAPGYRSDVLDVFSQLRQSDYDMAKEGAGVGTVALEAYVANPLPFRLGDPSLIGDFLVTYGHVIKAIGDRTRDLGRRPRVLELGCGQGALSYYLARSHFELTAMDVSPDMTAITKAVTAEANPAPRIVTSSFEDYVVDEPQDVVLFFESFHHCLNHFDIVGKFRDALAPGGIMVFAAEPITAPDNPVIPYPWGLRLDTISLRQIVINGWLELGFQRPYFMRMMEEAGLEVEDLRIPGIPRSHVIIAKRR